MNNTENKNLFQNLDGIKAVEELSDKAAATCAGGYFYSSSSSFSYSNVNGQETQSGSTTTNDNGNITTTFF